MEWLKKVATLGPIGYLKAPGTMGSLAALPVIIVRKMYSEIFLATAPWVTILSAICLWMLPPDFLKNDPSHIVIDEFAGMFFVFLSVVLTWKTLLVGFILFRALDISKLFGLSYVERIPGAWGIMLDDFCAGILANLFLRMMISYGVL